VTDTVASAGVPEAAAQSNRYVLVTVLCMLIATLDGLDTQCIAYVAPKIAEDWHTARGAFGPVFGAGLLGLMIGALALGPAADRFGRKPAVLLSIFWFGLLSLFTARVEGLRELMALRFLCGLGFGGALPNIVALTSEHAPPRLRATLVAVMTCGIPLGAAVGGFVTAPLIEAHGWRWVFALGGALPLLLLPVLWFRLPESPRFRAVRNGVDADAVERHRASIAALFAQGRAPATLLIWTAFFSNLLVMYLLVNWLPSLLKSEGVPLYLSIYVSTLFSLGGFFGGVIVGILIDRATPYVTLACAYVLAAACIAILAFAGTYIPLLLAGAAFAGFGAVGGQAGLNAVTAERYPTPIRSTGIGWALGFGRIGSIIGPTLAGLLLAFGWAPHALLLAAVVPALLSAAAVLALDRT
jgi:AAHS family 4-hydroxybenzoate transporter-like MFS transporter